MQGLRAGSLRRQGMQEEHELLCVVCECMGFRENGQFRAQSVVWVACHMRHVGRHVGHMGGIWSMWSGALANLVWHSRIKQGVLDSWQADRQGYMARRDVGQMPGRLL